MKPKRIFVALAVLALLTGTAVAQTPTPRLMHQFAPGETDPTCCVVALSVQSFFPVVHVGEPLPVSITGYNFVGVQATGLSDDAAVTVILEGRDRYEIPAIAYPFVGWPGIWNVLWWAPPCANGDYQIRLKVGEVESPSLMIRFQSDCSLPRRSLNRPARVQK